MSYNKEEFLGWLELRFGKRFFLEKIHKDMTPCVVWTGKTNRRWNVPMEGKKYVCRLVAEHVRGSLLKEESPYRLCCNKLCINPEHFSITKKGETCWFHKDADLYFRRKETMKNYSRKVSVKFLENEVKARCGCVAKPSMVRALLRKKSVQEGCL